MARGLPTPRTAPFHLSLLGAFRLTRQGEPLRLPTRKHEMLLAYLVLQPAKHPREKLASLFWGDVSELRARNSLRVALARLRQVLGKEILSIDRETIQLEPTAPLWVDVRELEQPTAGSQPAVLELYRGDLLADLDAEWLLPLREHYRARYLAVLLSLTQQERTRGEYVRAAAYARRALATDAANERAHQHLMFCYLAVGDRAAALKQYEECKRVLEIDLAVEPAPETTALYEWLRQAPPDQSAAARITNLPIPVSSFIGRQRELVELQELLTESGGAAAEETTSLRPSSSLPRLITLTGAGGSGKTRLAIQTATALIDAFKDGVWWIELAPLMDAALIPQVVAQVLGVREKPNQALTATLKHFIGDKHLLLMLDNCEHLIESCAQFSEQLLTACPNLRLITTSREALGITGEVTFPVPTLARPVAAEQVREMLQYEAVRLFVERARAVKPDLELTGENAGATAQICRRLDGIPLALELAAARCKSLSVEEIATRLDDRFELLTIGSRIALPRHQTLRASIDWSYDLLADQERALFRRLTVFTGGRTLAAAQAVCSGQGLMPERILDLLARLVDRSLLLTEQRNGVTRYYFLETIREYARQKLEQSGELDRLREHHLRFFLRLAETAEPELIGAEQNSWLDRLESEIENLRTAQAWAFTRPSERELTLRLSAALWRFWEARGALSEGRGWLERELGQDAAFVAPLVRAKALLAAGALAGVQSDYAAARKWLRESESVARNLDDTRILGYSLSYQGWISIRQGDLPTARALLVHGQQLLQQCNDQWGLVYVLSHLVNVTRNQGDYAAAHAYFEQALTFRSEVQDRRLVAGLLTSYGELLRCEGDYGRAGVYYEESLACSREADDKRGQALAWHNLGYVARQQGEFTRAIELFDKSLAIYRETDDKRGMALCVAGLAGVAASLGQTDQATRLLSATQALFQSIGSVLSAADRIEFERTVEALRQALSEEDFAAAWEEGQKLTLEQATEAALGVH